MEELQRGGMQIDENVMSYLKVQIDSCDNLLNQINISIQRMRNKPVIFSGNPYGIHHQFIYLFIYINNFSLAVYQ